MSRKRRWTQWPRRLVAELNGTSGVAGAGGVALGVAGMAGVAGAAAAMLAVVGAVLTVGAIGYSAIKSFPPGMRSPEEVAGSTIAVSELDSIFPPLPRLAIIGPTQAGKTTLKNRMAFQLAASERTQNITAYVTALQTTPPLHLAVLDGGGERFAQQFKLAEISDFICVVLDHNKSDAESSVDSARLQQHREFLKQVRHQLDEATTKKKQWVHFLLNKHDLWQKASTQQQQEFLDFYTSEIDHWRQGRFSETVHHAQHCNSTADDISKFMSLIKESVKRRLP